MGVSNMKKLYHRIMHRLWLLFIYKTGIWKGDDGYEPVEPFCRCSGYSSSKENMEIQLKGNIWELRNCVENQYCNGGRGCVD